MIHCIYLLSAATRCGGRTHAIHQLNGGSVPVCGVHYREFITGPESAAGLRIHATYTRDMADGTLIPNYTADITIGA